MARPSTRSWERGYTLIQTQAGERLIKSFQTRPGTAMSAQGTLTTKDWFEETEVRLFCSWAPRMLHSSQENAAAATRPGGTAPPTPGWLLRGPDKPATGPPGPFLATEARKNSAVHS